jgi:general secretion pathway protein C
MNLENLKYHALNALSVALFSFITALTINQFIKFAITPEYNSRIKQVRTTETQKEKKDFAFYNSVIESGFFRIADQSADGEGGEGQAQQSALDELTLMGTITGPASIARALIMKRGERYPQIFALYKVNSEITNDVYGYTLVSIRDTKVNITSGESKYTLDMYAKKEVGGQANSQGPAEPGESLKKTISRSEIEQNVLNNMDNALKGLRAGPYRDSATGEITGFRLIKVRPYNILYKLGARDGDIIKRINGKKIDSTEKLYKMWDALKTDSRINADIERGGKILTFEYNISE